MPDSQFLPPFAVSLTALGLIDHLFTNCFLRARASFISRVLCPGNYCVTWAPANPRGDRHTKVPILRTPSSSYLLLDLGVMGSTEVGSRCPDPGYQGLPFNPTIVDLLDPTLPSSVGPQQDPGRFPPCVSISRPIPSRNFLESLILPKRRARETRRN